jgi:hypothetical protein
MRYESKDHLLAAIEREHQRFLALARTIPEHRYDEPGVWGDGWTVKDLFAHLTAWEQLFLSWYRHGSSGTRPAMPAPGFTWRQTPALNRQIWDEHRDSAWADVRSDFEASFEEVRRLAESLSEEELLEPGHFSWTRRNPLVTYLGANTASHYRTAAKILKRWLRSQRPS